MSTPDPNIKYYQTELSQKRREVVAHLSTITDLRGQLKVARGAYETEKQSAQDQHNVILAALDILSTPCPQDMLADDYRRWQIERAKVTLEAAG